ncbi:hypothetical protein [Sulfuritalea sp.]|uniref:hypothetical protein n=1 Tax=Sulfuritalea sp. TaxID=2480090 RepID=UPI001AC4A29E|nr:hypothetical protein [Sulfuritalea sp.]MBN8477235.1 hypothetical protein [Sulfuritalea sp.]
MHVKFAQSLRYQDDNTDTARVRPLGEIQRHATSNINIGEALRASGERQRNTILLFTLDLRGEALVVKWTSVESCQLWQFDAISGSRWANMDARDFHIQAIDCYPAIHGFSAIVEHGLAYPVSIPHASAIPQAARLRRWPM